MGSHCRQNLKISLRQKCTKKRAARLFCLIQPIKSLVFCVDVVISSPYFRSFIALRFVPTHKSETPAMLLACRHANAMGMEDNSNNISVHFNKHNIDASTLIALTIHDCIQLFFKKFYPHLTINDHFKTVESSLIRDLNNLQFA